MLEPCEPPLGVAGRGRRGKQQEVPPPVGRVRVCAYDEMTLPLFDLRALEPTQTHVRAPAQRPYPHRQRLLPASGGDHGSQIAEGLSYESRQILLVGLVDPALEGDSEDGDSRLGSEARGRVLDAALTKRSGKGGGQRCELDQL